jgi:hypothetical protein
VVFPGNIQGRHIRETGSKGCTLVAVDDGKIASVEHHPLDVLRWAVCDADVSEAADMDAVLDCAQAALSRQKDDADGRPLAVRLRLSGSCAAHAELHAHEEQCIAELRSLAGRMGDVWVEKVVLQTGFRLETAFLRQRSDSLGHILQSIDRWDENASDFDELIRSLDDLKRRLPPELRMADSEFTWETPEKRSQLAQSVKQILLPRLISISRDL